MFGFEDVFYDEEPYLSNQLITNTSRENDSIDGLIVSKILFQKVSLIHSNFNKIDMTDVIFENCDLSNSTFNEGIIHRVTFKNSKLVRC
ncbi:pentapeptide repeat-containing protein [Lysinibacillus xylanilyticus]|uniref:pentapeptide repeat-containing protein n=1 Tax=Lysinibacillus xylanilyticus TaxID=582475 RepID=UPI002B3CD85D|nr:pentapeptide repeat-containing protein [Lysinibacillus xylanilyticus]